MNKFKRELLDKTFQTFMEVGLGGENLDLLHDMVAKDVVGFGTTIDEKIFGVKELEDLIIRQKEQSAGMEVSWKINTLDIHISLDENTSIYTNDLILYLTIEGNTIEMYMRFSVVLEYEQNKWMVVHWHGSKPEQVESEKDTWGIETWKEKAEELEKQVAERTADLVVKNRELEIEAATERVRAQSMAMHHPEDLDKVNKELLAQLNKLEIPGLTGVSFYLLNQEGIVTVWDLSSPGNMTNPNSYTFRFDSKKLPVMGEFVETLNSTNEDYFVLDYPKQKILLAIEELKDIDVEIANLLMKAVESGALQHQWNPAARITDGILSIDLITQPTNETKSIVLKMAGAFNLAYQRFLDLQKAEAQAREAEIEAAVEKVRSRSLAMHNSSELNEVVKVLFEKITELQVPSTAVGIQTFIEGSKDMQVFVCGDVGTGIVVNQYVLPYFDHPIVHDYLNAHKNKLEAFVGNYSKKVKDSFYDVILKLPELNNLAAEVKTMIHDSDFYEVTIVPAEKSLIAVNDFLGNPLAESQVNILKRFAKVFDQAYTRFLDIQKAEGQAREAQIEAALEKVRSRTMGMQQSNELAEVANVLFGEMNHLVHNLWTCGFVLCESDRQEDEWWLSLEDGFSRGFYLPNVNDFAHATLYEGWLVGETFRTVQLDGDKLQAHYDWLMEIPVAKNIFDDMEAAGMKRPDWQKLHAAYFSKGYLVLITREPCGEEEIFKRFAQVFDQTYTRFLDLQKAEAQAREAQIEAGLERVRSTAMAMHRSDDLRFSLTKVFEELDKLNLAMIRCGIAIIDPSKPRADVWIMAKSGDNNTIQLSGDEPLDTNFMLMEAYEAWKKGNDYEYTLEGEKISEYYSALDQNGFQSDLYSTFSNVINTRRQHFFNAVFKHGSLFAFFEDQMPDFGRTILKRFSNVLNLAYSRFHDIQFAEAQAHEAQIENALEKVRSQSLAMHKSYELNEVVSVLFEKLKELQIPFTAVGIATNIEASKDLNAFVCGQNEAGLIITNYRLPYFDNQIPKDLYSAIEEQLDYFVGHYSKEEKDSFYEYVIEHTAEFKHLPEDIKRMIFESPTYSISMVAVKNAVFNINDFEGKILANHEIDIIKRFARVFDQAYTRFLDLQKAEARAREAKIEASLERVRSRTMAMHKTDELQEVVRVVAEELKNTGVILDTWGAVICTYFQDSNDVLHWTAAEDPANPSIAFLLPYFRDELYDEAWTSKNRGDSYFAKVFSFEVKNTFFKHAFKHSDYRYLPEDYKKIILKRESHGIAWAWAKNSAIMIPSVEGDLPSDIEKEILIRFAKVFEQAYVRFMDLQRAEAQALEVKIELSLERIRARVTSMQESSDLLDIVVSMRAEFVKLGHEAHYFWHMRWLPERYDKAMTSGDGTKIGMVMTLPRHIHGDIVKVANWEKSNEPTHVLAMDAETAVDYVHKMITLGDFERVDPQAPTLDDIRHIGGLTFVMARTTHGEIGFSLPGVVTEPSRDAVDTLVRFAGVFDLAYKRFEDLKTAEKDLIEIKAAREKAEETLQELKATQSQLVQQEKLASLGQLTAGIAHEIKNPLNFVNNFSEVSIELIDELRNELDQVKTQYIASQQTDLSNIEEAESILNDLKSNLSKIFQHGFRANSIVTSMLQHSRGGTGEKEPTDLNALVKEYVNLCFHGMRAAKNPINVTIALDLDSDIHEVSLIHEDFTRVIINLCNNAFDAMRQKKLLEPEDYQPKLSVRSKSERDFIVIEVKDNGPGIPDDIKDKILQPFFTTKKGTEGTGLGLSITHDIVKAHGGELEVESQEGVGTAFIIKLLKEG